MLASLSSLLASPLSVAVFFISVALLSSVHFSPSPVLACVEVKLVQ
jgi:hypothetical protein